MTRRRQTHEKADGQREVITALRSVGCLRIADRLQRCIEVRLSRRHGDGWPEVCRSAGCEWCGPTLAWRWWRGVARWIVEAGGPVSIVVLPLHRETGYLRAHVARTRRVLRDVRDRTARRNWRWRGVALSR